MKKIYDLGKKIINISELQEFFKIDDYKKFVKVVEGLINEEVLIPVKASKSNGMVPPLYNRYRVKEQEEDLTYLKEEINYNFPVIFDREFYLNNLKKYKEDRAYIKEIADYFINMREELKSPMSINERSFSIWGEEKFLKDGYGKTILKNLGLTIEEINIYGTPEPFVYFSCNKEEKQRVLIIENKDTWYTIRKLMIEGKKEFLGEYIDTIIYGSGKNIEKSLEEYEYTVEEYLLNPVKVFYWGDIDYEGMLIYERLKRRYSGKLNIELFKNAYIKMIELGKAKKLQPYKDKQNKNIEGVFLDEMEEVREDILNLLKAGVYIPQEIINYLVLRKE